MALLLESFSALLANDWLIVKDVRADLVVAVDPLVISANYSALSLSLSHNVGIKVLAELKKAANFLSLAAWAEIL
jgi:hypothetical protein